MSDNYYIELYCLLHSKQDKYTYFLMAASASAIAYTLSRAEYSVDTPLR